MDIKIYFTICLLSLLSWALPAQNGGNIGIGTITPDSSAMLDISSENKGLLVPHVKLVAIDDSISPILHPANGLFVYHTGENDIEMGFYYWNGHEWVGLCSCPVVVSGVEITPSSMQSCLNSPVTLTASATPSNGTYTYEWTHNGATMSGCTSASPSILLTTTGDHAFAVTVRDNNGQTATASATVTVNANPEVTVTPPIDAGCTPIQSKTLTASCTNCSSDPTYAWHASTGQDLSGESIVVTPSVSTTYTVTVTDGNGCSVIDSTIVNVRNPLAQQTEFTVNGVSFKMNPVKGGTFLMGSQKNNSNDPNYDTDAHADDREAPVHQVTLTKDYAIGETEVTQALWLAVMETWPQYAPTEENGLGPNYPAYNVSWDDIMAENTGFLDKLNDSLQSQRCGLKFVLPTEAQWEFAAAGGKRGYRDNGSRIHKYSGSDNIDEVAWYDDTDDKSHEVGALNANHKQPNELGLYDMSGNVWEWCSDWYNKEYYGSSPNSDPTGPDTANNRVHRGGNWISSSEKSRVAYRSNSNPSGRSYGLGFRLALVQD